MSDQTKTEAVKAFLPIIIVFILINLLPVVFSSMLEKVRIDQGVLLIGNLVLFGVTVLSFLLYQKAMIAGNTIGFIKNVYGGMFLKFFVCIIAAFIYIFNARQAVNKSGVFALMFLYLVYTFLEISILMKHSKHKKMPKREAPLSSLDDYIPPGSSSLVFEYLKHYKVHLTITRSRKTVLGDYRHAIGSKNHRISVNGNLNTYSFLITLIHELAHLLTFLQFGNRVFAHGKEWKHIYREMLVRFLVLKIFPEDIHSALERSLHNLPVSSCADEGLMRVLQKYDTKKNGLVMVEQLKEGLLFEIDEGKIFRKGKLLRKRFQCVEVKTGKLYLFSPIYEVKPVLTDN